MKSIKLYYLYIILKILYIKFNSSMTDQYLEKLKGIRQKYGFEQPHCSSVLTPFNRQ